MKFILIQLQRLQVQNQCIDRVPFFRSLSLACSLSFPLSSHGLPSECACILISTTGHQTYWIREHPNDFILIWASWRPCLYIYSHILSFWGLGLQHEFWKGSVQPLTGRQLVNFEHVDDDIEFLIFLHVKMNFDSVGKCHIYDKCNGVKSGRKGHLTFKGPLPAEEFLRTRKTLSHHIPEKENKTVAIVRSAV